MEGLKHTHTHYFTTLITTFLGHVDLFLFLYHVLRFARPREEV